MKDVGPDKMLWCRRAAALLGSPGLLVVHLNSSLLLAGTPLHNILADGRLDRSCCSTIHTSDIYRLAVLHRSIQPVRPLQGKIKSTEAALRKLLIVVR